MLAAISFPTLERIPLGGDFAVSPHGIGIALGFVIGAILLVRRAEKRGLGHVYVEDISESIQELLVRAAIGSLIGARLFFVLTHLDQFVFDPLAAGDPAALLEIFALWQGGLTFLGGLFGAIVAAVPLMRRRGYRPLQVLDSAAPGLALGLAIGRTGDLMIGDHIGRPAPDVALAWQCTGNYWQRATNSFGFVAPEPYPFDAAVAPTLGCFDVPVIQTAMLDFLAAGIVFLLLIALERKARFDGFFVTAFVFGYGGLRFLTDFLRQDRTWFGLTGSQWAIVATLTVVVAWLVRTKPWQERPWAWDLEFAHPWHESPTGEDVAVEDHAESGDAAPVRPAVAVDVEDDADRPAGG